MKKRLLSILLSVSMLGGMFSLGSCGKNQDSAGYVTRGQWISMLAETFGMDNYQTSTPYYEDVGSSSALFDAVQAAFEWDVLSPYPASGKLDADKLVTGEEAAASAAIAAGCPVEDTQFESNGKYNCAFAVNYAVEHNIISSSTSLPKRMTQEECEELLEAAQLAYMAPGGEESALAEYSENVEQLAEADTGTWQFGSGSVSIPKGSGNVSLGGGTAPQTPGTEAPGTEEPGAEAPGEGTSEPEASSILVETGDGTKELEVGDVFVTAPTEENPSGTAYKVTAIEETDGEIVLATEAPGLEDLYEELSVHMTASADPSKIIWAPGVSSGALPSASPNGMEYQISLLSAARPDAHAELLGKAYSMSTTKSFEFGSGSFKKETSNSSAVLGGGKGAQAFEDSNFVYDKTPSIEDFNGGTSSWTKNLEVENKFSGGYKITGTISINALTVKTDVEYKKSWLLKIPYGIESASVTVTSDISSTLKLEGNLSEKLKIATIPIPIAATGLNVSVELYLYADASGSLTVQAGLGSSAKVEYSDGKLKQTATSNASASVEAAIQLDFGAELTATLDALGIVKIMDAGVKAGGTLTASAYIGGTCEVTEEDGITTMVYRESMNIKADLYVPIISVSVGGSNTLIGKLGLSKTWNIMTASKGAKHFALLNEEWVFWEETVTLGADGEVEDSETVTAGPAEEIGPSDDVRLDLDTYMLAITGAPERLNLVLPEGEAAPAVVWHSDNPAVAVVDSSGLVSPVSTGYTIITAALADDPSVYVKCAVFVQEIGEENWQFLPSELAYQI